MKWIPVLEILSQILVIPGRLVYTSEPQQWSAWAALESEMDLCPSVFLLLGIQVQLSLLGWGLCPMNRYSVVSHVSAFTCGSRLACSGHS